MKFEYFYNEEGTYTLWRKKQEIIFGHCKSEKIAKLVVNILNTLVI